MDETLAAATIKAQAERQRVVDLARLAASRLRPQSLAQEAGNKLLDLGLDVADRSKAAMRTHPARTIGLVAIAGAILARGPLLRLVTSAARRARSRWHELRDTKEQPWLRWKKWIGKE
jgi:hypothetical protein